MRSSWFTALAAGAVLVGGCKDDPTVIEMPDSPRAVVRFINAVPDTLGTDWRFIDRLTGSPVELALGFRSVGPYQAAAPGSRPLRVFPATTDLSTANFFVDQAVMLDANKRYTLAHVGMSRPNQTPADQLLVVEDIQPTVDANKVAIRAWHLGTGIGNVDIYTSKAGDTTALGTPRWANVAYLASTPFAMVDAGPKTGVVPLGTWTRGYARQTGSFTTDGFTVGQQILAAGFAAAASNGRSIVSGIIPSKTTGAVSLGVRPVGFVRSGGSFITDGFIDGAPITVTGFSLPDNNGRFYISRVAAETLYVGATTGSMALAATATTYTRASSSGSFITDGFYIGQTINAAGFTNAANNGQGVISNLTATTMTLAARTPSLVAEASASGRSLTGLPTLVTEPIAPGRTIVSDELITIQRPSTASMPVPSVATGSQTLVGELVYRATLAGSTAVIAEWTALTGLPADLALGQEAIGGNTIGGSALVGILMPRSVSGSSAPQSPPTTVPPTPPYTAPTFIFAVDKHPR
jgi:hypothetical protein